jgi:hypothetical protein
MQQVNTEAVLVPDMVIKLPNDTTVDSQPSSLPTSLEASDEETRLTRLKDMPVIFDSLVETELKGLLGPVQNNPRVCCPVPAG